MYKILRLKSVGLHCNISFETHLFQILAMALAIKIFHNVLISYYALYCFIETNKI